MIPFIFFISIIVLVLLIGSFILKNYTLGMISTMALVVVGVDILSNGMQGINNILTLGIGIIFTSIGLYIFLNGSLQQIETY